MEEPVARSNGEFTSLNSSLSSLDNSDAAISLPTATREDEGIALTGSTTSQDPNTRREAEDLSQWQCEFRGQIRAVRQWLSSMEKMLPTLDPRLQSDGQQSSDQDSGLDRWRGTKAPLALKDVSTNSEMFLQNLEALVTWVSEIEELTANQKPPSSEVKVVKAQLQEQKLLLRLLTDRRRSMVSVMVEGPRLVEAHPGEEWDQAKVKLATLQQKWEALQMVAEKRRECLELILPKAKQFQEGVDSLQQWFISVEQTLAELRNAERMMLHLSDATDKAKAVVEEIQVQMAELGKVKMSGQTLMKAVSVEEAQQVQEKMDALHIRCSVLNLSSMDVLQRLEQALEASSRCTSSQEDLHLWLGRIERELLGAAGAPTQVGDAGLCAAEKQRVSFPRYTKIKLYQGFGYMNTLPVIHSRFHANF
ncbi:dystonin-like [Fundulus heteroclitus]|uniref:dystonin-like n=1 Tax=Fundulus heteroclitus TaxID=8078 RepID=UPI00165B1676|nr:dystonin-like [Fundulus heteroclitus]